MNTRTHTHTHIHEFSDVRRKLLNLIDKNECKFWLSERVSVSGETIDSQHQTAAYELVLMV